MTPEREKELLELSEKVMSEFKQRHPEEVIVFFISFKKQVKEYLEKQHDIRMQEAEQMKSFFVDHFKL